jgi:hypothetical protein
VHAFFSFGINFIGFGFGFGAVITGRNIASRPSDHDITNQIFSGCFFLY